MYASSLVNQLITFTSSRFSAMFVIINEVARIHQIILSYIPYNQSMTLYFIGCDSFWWGDKNLFSRFDISTIEQCLSIQEVFLAP